MRRRGRLLAVSVVVASLLSGCTTEEKSTQESSETVRTVEVGNRIDDTLCVAPHLCSEDTENCRRELEFALSLMSDAGIRTIRVDFPWSQIESRNDSYDMSHQAFQIDWAERYGIEVLALLAYCTQWACQDDITSSIDVEEYAEYAGMVAATLGDRLTYYEVWNEEDLSGIFWKPFSDPRRYGELLEAASTAVRQNDPDAKVLFGGLAGVCPLTLFPSPDCVWGFYTQVKGAHPDIDDYFDIFNIHGYSWNFLLAPEWNLPLLEITCPALGDKISIGRTLSGKPVWNTEFGWQCEPHYPALTKQLQAAYLARGYIVAAASKAERSCWYTFWHEGTGMGLIDEDWHTPKPAYYALKALHELLGRFRPCPDPDDLSEQLALQGSERAYLLADNQGVPKAVALWAVAPNHEREALLRIPFSKGPFKVYDMFGNVVMTPNGRSAELEVKISNYPIYILW